MIPSTGRLMMKCPEKKKGKKGNAKKKVRLKCEDDE